MQFHPCYPSQAQLSRRKLRL